MTKSKRERVFQKKIIKSKNQFMCDESRDRWCGASESDQYCIDNSSRDRPNFIFYISLLSCCLVIIGSDFGDPWPSCSLPAEWNTSWWNFWRHRRILYESPQMRRCLRGCGISDRPGRPKCECLYAPRRKRRVGSCELCARSQRTYLSQKAQ